MASRLMLRLDDGSLIGDAARLEQAASDSGSVVRITVEQAFEIGRAGEAELRRLERVMSSLQGVGPSRNGHLQHVPPIKPLPNPKRARLESAPSLQQDDFYPKLRKIFSSCVSHLGPQNKGIFWLPVNKGVVLDYYKVIKNPLSLSEVDQRLSQRRYQSPHDFYNDMMLIWNNCRTYNKPQDLVGKLGLQEEEYFKEQWAASGWADDARGRRATAGVAAAKFDPEAFLPPTKPKPKASSGARAPSVSAAAAPARSGRKPSNSARGAAGGAGGNHEVTSQQQHAQSRQAAPPLSTEAPVSNERRMEIATLLGELGADENSVSHMEAALQLIPQNYMRSDNDGEFELDFESIDDATMKQLDIFLRNLAGGAASPTAASMNPSVRLDADSSEDDDGGAGSDSD